MAQAEHVIVYRAPGDLLAYDRNARTHSAAQVDGIARSIQRFGFNAPVLLKDDDATIGAGHGRQLAALKILADPKTWGALHTPDGATVPTITLRGLTEAEWRAYVIADNRLAEQAGWDFDLLKDELASLRLEDESLAGIAGFDDTQLAALLGLGAAPTLEQLQQQFGAPSAADFWPEYKLKLPPALHKKLAGLLNLARPAGEDEWRRFEAVLDAVDKSKLPA